MDKFKYLRFANKGAIDNNPILAAFYMVAYPLAILSMKYNIAPNTITLLSFFLTCFSVLLLICGEVFAFIIFWLISFILDFVDGSLARMTGRIETSALDLDHISDIIKILFVFLGYGLYFESRAIWALSFLSSGFYIFYTLINHELDWASKCLGISKYSSKKDNSLTGNTGAVLSDSPIKRNLKKYFQERPFQKKVFLVSLTTLTVVHAHTLLIFVFIPLDLVLGCILMACFLSVVSYQTIRRLIHLKRLNRVVFK